MSVTVFQLHNWSPASLEAAAAGFETARNRLADTSADLQVTVRMLNDGWAGAASEAASASIRAQAAVAANLVDSLSLARRSLLAAADSITAARALLFDAEVLAARHDLRLTADGVAQVGLDGTDEQREARGQVFGLLAAALEAAHDADRDGARAVRAALSTADLTATQERELVEDIGVFEPFSGLTVAGVTRWWASLPPAARARLEREQPEMIGNLDGLPYDARLRANRRNIADTLDASRAEIGELEALIADLEESTRRAGESVGAGARGYPDIRELQALAGAHERLAAARDMEAFCQDLLTGTTVGFDGTTQIGLTGHQVLVFDPANGRFAEIVGTIGPGTRNIGVLVGGTGSNLLGMDGDYRRALEFVTAPSVEPDGSLAVISYLGGPMPQRVLFEAFDTSYATNQGGELARFVNGIDNPIEAPVTVVGHSYGGSVVGAAEVAGMHADRVLHLESAGAGPGVQSESDYAYPDTDRYAMTAPDDPIGPAQGTSIGSLGHGADPDDLDGVVRLETGLIDVGDPSSGILRGGSAHSGVFNPNTTAFGSILGVMTGDDVSLYRPADWVQLEVDGLIVDKYQYPMEDPTYRPPTMDVP